MLSRKPLNHVLSYWDIINKPSALQYDLLPLCSLPEHKQEKFHSVSNVEDRKDQHQYSPPN